MMNASAYQDSDPCLLDESRTLGLKAAHVLGHPDATLFSLDVDEASARLSGVYNTNRLRVAGSPGNFRMRLRTAQVGRLGLATLSFGAEVDIEQAGDRPFVLVTAQVGGFSRVATAGRVAEGGGGFVVVDSAGQSVSKRFSSDSERCNVRIDQAVIDGKCAALLGRPLDRPLSFSPFGANNGVVQRRWLGLLQMLLGYAGLPALSPVNPIVHHLEEAVLLHLLLEHEHLYSAELRQGQASLAPRHVRRAEDYIRNHVADALTLEQISAAVGCSIRTLTDGFRKARGTTPMNFLRQLRLERARDDLRQGGSPGVVSDVALRWGFPHLGRFAAEYRRQFAESPSETLRRSG